LECNGVATNMKEMDELKAGIPEQASEIEDPRAACPNPVKARHAALPPPAESTPPQAVSGDEAKARMARVNNDRSAYQQQGLRPAGGARGRRAVARARRRSRRAVLLGRLERQTRVAKR